MQTAAPGFWDQPEAARAVLAEATRHRAVVGPFEKAAAAAEEATLLYELAATESDATARDQALAEVRTLLARCEKAVRSLEVQALLADRFDANNAYLTLHAGAGGTESCDWAAMLFRMYRRYAEEHDFQLEPLEIQPGEEAGLRSVSFLVSGPMAYGYLKAERGVHRLVRISPFDANKRRHTSFAAMDVVAELNDDVEVEILDDDLRVDTYRSSGKGGQHVNTTDSAIRLTHLPTGMVVACQAERSQHKNRAKAMSMLKAKVYEYNQDLKRKEMERFYGKKGEIAWGSQIRSYVLQPYTMVKDHRTKAETSNVSAVLDGDIDLFIEAWLKQRAQNKVEPSDAASV
jgi:peptide chain release factor 2